MLPPARAPAWVMPGAKFDIDFVNNRFWGGTVQSFATIQNSNSQESLIGGMWNQNAGSYIYFPELDGHLTNGGSVKLGVGLYVDNDITNNALYSRDLTQSVWTKTNCTAALSQVGMDLNPASASLVTATSASATALQAVTLSSSSTVLTSMYIRRVSGSGTIQITQDGSTFTNVTSQLNTSNYVRVNTPIQTLTNLSIGIQLGTSGDSIIVDFVQAETQSGSALPLNIPTHPLYNTNSARRRYVAEPTINVVAPYTNSAGQRICNDVVGSGHPWSFFGVYTGTPPATGCFISSDGSISASGGCEGLGFSFGGATTTNLGNPGFGNINRVTGRSNGYAQYACMNGGPIAAYPSPFQHMAPSHCGIGNNGAGQVPLNGLIKRMAFWDYEISDGQMIEFSRVLNNV